MAIVVSTGEAIIGTGSPEGILAAPPGAVYMDDATGVLYAKRTGIGDTGWVEQGGAGGSGLTHPQVLARSMGA